MGTYGGWVGVLGGLAGIWLICLGIAWILEGIFGHNLQRQFVRGTGRLLRSLFFWTGRAASNTTFYGHRASRRHFPRATAAFFALVVLIILYYWFSGR